MITVMLSPLDEAPLISKIPVSIEANTDGVDIVALCQSTSDFKIHARHTEMCLHKWHGRVEFLQL
jgi:hypothetical protein